MGTDADPSGPDDTRFLFSEHRQALPHGGTRIVYAIRVEGREAAALGPLVTADVAQVLAALEALAAA